MTGQLQILVPLRLGVGTDAEPASQELATKLKRSWLAFDPLILAQGQYQSRDADFAGETGFSVTNARSR